MVPIRVLIINDSATDRAIIKAILQTDPALQIVGEGLNGQDAVAQASHLGPDLILMDLLMPGIHGAEAVRRIMSVNPTRILIVTALVARNSK